MLLGRRGGILFLDYQTLDLEFIFLSLRSLLFFCHQTHFIFHSIQEQFLFIQDLFFTSKFYIQVYFNAHRLFHVQFHNVSWLIFNLLGIGESMV